MKTLSSFSLPEILPNVVDESSWWLRESGGDLQDSIGVGNAFDDDGNGVEANDPSPCFLRVRDQYVPRGDGGHH